MDRAFPTMIRKDNSPKHKLQETFQLLMSIERKRRLSTVKGIKICRLNFRRFHRVLGPFLGISGNYRSPITYPSVIKQNGRGKSSLGLFGKDALYGFIVLIYFKEFYENHKKTSCISDLLLLSRYICERAVFSVICP